MLRDITLGQYYQTESVIHRMDPRVKLGGTLLFIISLFFFKNYAGYVIAALFLGMVIRLSKVPFKFMVKGMKTIVMLMMITVVFNLFLTQGTPLVTIWKLTITQEGLKMAISMAIRLTLLIIGSSVMTLTTTPNNLTDGMEKMMGPLKVFKVPVHEVAMMMSIALRFIPILLEETDKIMKAQIARHFQACQSHGAPAGTAVYLRVPQSQRPCHGNGGQMLSRRRGQDEDETADLS
jgi:energy-coupling factor transport system permease protein